jgi:hypothetical protein
MICPICENEMSKTDLWLHCLDCHVYFYPKIKDYEEDTEYRSEYSFEGKSYSRLEFEHRCKMKAFW